MNKIKKYSDALEITLKNKDLQMTGIELTETFGDQLLNEGLAREIPILGTIVGLGKAGIAIKDHLFLKKVLSFLSNLQDLPAEQRNDMISKIDNSGKFKIKVGEKLLYILDKCEDHEKAVIIADLFKAYIQERIQYSDYIEGSRIVENISSKELDFFVQNDWEELSIEESSDYLNSGLFELLPISMTIEESVDDSAYENPQFRIKGGDLKTSITEMGKKIRLALKKTTANNI